MGLSCFVVQSCAILIPLPPPIPSDVPIHMSSSLLAALQPVGLGAPKANRANPAGAGNAEGNWWTPSTALDTDCDGRPVTALTKLTRECIYEKKVAEIKTRQAITAE